MTDREDPFVENGPRDEIVIQGWEMKSFIAWFHKTCPKIGPKWTVCWEDWRGTYDLATNTISWDYSVAGMPEAEHRRRRQKEGIQMIPAIVLPEPKPFYGIDPIMWHNLTEVEREKAKVTYFESVDALKSLYPGLLDPIVVMK